MKRIDRRALFATGAAAALLAATGASLADQPRRGGTLRLALPREGDLLARVARAAVCDQLTEVAPDGLLRGELATQWQSDDTATIWRFELRKDALFHDGTALTGADVVASLQAHLASGTHALGAVHDLYLDSDRAVIFVLAEGNPHLPYRLADAGLIVAKDGLIHADLDALIGTGLYRPERAQDGRHFRASRVEAHARDGKAGWFEALDLIVIPDADVRAEALREGYVDIAALPTAQGLSGRGAFQYHPSEGEMALAAAEHIVLPTRISTRGPLDDLRIAERWWHA